MLSHIRVGLAPGVRLSEAPIAAATTIKPGAVMQDEATYVCDSCGEEIVVPLDLSAGESQEYVEDCPVCCRPNLIHIEIDEHAQVRVWAERE